MAVLLLGLALGACGDSLEESPDGADVFVPPDIPQVVDTSLVNDVTPDAPADSALDSSVADAVAETVEVKDVAVEVDTTPTCTSPFVYLKDKQFWIGAESWAPISVNYIFDIRHTPDDDYYIAPHASFCATPAGCCDDRDSCRAAAQAQLAQIKAMGLNSLRIVGLAVIPQDGTVVLDCAHQWPDWLDYCPKSARLVMSPPDPRGLALIADALQLVEDAGLRGILLAGHHALDAPGVRDHYASYLTALATRFADEPTLFAYDLTNEPVYEFADKDIAKIDANAIGRLWYDAVRAGSTRHMVTYGLAELGTIRHWDPGSLPLDFASFHIYGPGTWSATVRDYLSTFFGWMGREPYPVMVGEIGLSPEVDGATESDQELFAEHAVAASWACGSMGLQWWLYRDVHWGPPGEQFGLVRWDGSARPAAGPFADFVPWQPRPQCPQPAYLGNAPEALNLTTGRVVRDDGSPVANALVSGHKCFTGGYDWTLSGPDGRFELRSTSLIAELEVTASGLSLESVPLGCNLMAPGDVTLKTLPLQMQISTPDRCRD